MPYPCSIVSGRHKNWLFGLHEKEKEEHRGHRNPTEDTEKSTDHGGHRRKLEAACGGPARRGPQPLPRLPWNTVSSVTSQTLNVRKAWRWNLLTAVLCVLCGSLCPLRSCFA